MHTCLVLEFTVNEIPSDLKDTGLEATIGALRAFYGRDAPPVCFCIPRVQVD
jgi:hypothetical protein